MPAARCHICNVRKHLAVAGAALLLVSGCGGDEGAPNDVVYRVSVAVASVSPPLESEGRAPGDVERVEWVSPSTGAFRTESEGPVEPGSSAIYRAITVCTRSACAKLSSREQPSVRIGSRDFIRQWRDESFAFEALRRHLEGGTIEDGTKLSVRRDGVEFTLVVEGRIGRDEAERRKLFDIP